MVTALDPCRRRVWCKTALAQRCPPGELRDQMCDRMALCLPLSLLLRVLLCELLACDMHLDKESYSLPREGVALLLNASYLQAIFILLSEDLELLESLDWLSLASPGSSRRQ